MSIIVAFRVACAIEVIPATGAETQNLGVGKPASPQPVWSGKSPPPWAWARDECPVEEVGE